MLGAIAGDIIGSAFEFRPFTGPWEWCLFSSPGRHFTDDTVMTCAVADALRYGYGRDGLHDIFIDAMHFFGNTWPMAGYGGKFIHWLRERRRDPYNSFGLGAAMRVSPVGWLARSLDEAESLAAISAGVSHNHREGIRGAQAVAGTLFLARTVKSRDEIRQYISNKYNYDVSRPLYELRAASSLDGSCQVGVPKAMRAFLESASFEDALRKAIWLGGAPGTQAAIAGSIAEAFYGKVPERIASSVLERLDDRLYDTYLAWSLWMHGL